MKLASGTLLLSLSLAAAAPPIAGGEPPALRIHTREPGAYRLAYEDLAAAGLAAGDLAADTVGLENLGRPVPIWVEDGGDGVFGAGDWIEFVAEVLGGDDAYHHEYSTTNVYRLRFDAPDRRRMVPGAGLRESGEEPGRRLWRRRHLEEDLLLARLAGTGPSDGDSGPPEPWFWAKLTHTLRRPWTLDLDLEDLDAGSEDPVALRIHFRALSESRGDTGGRPHHRLEVAVGGSPITVAEWDGRSAYLLQAPELPASLFAGGTPRLELRIPKRLDARGNPLVDVVMLNWIEIDYPRRATVGEEPVHLHLGTGPATGPVRLRSKAEALVAYGDRGSRVEASAIAGREGFAFRPLAGETSIHVVPDGRLESPERIEVDRPSALRSAANRADYLMIAHRRLIAAIEPLADFHRRRGLAVAVVDVEDVYDEFNHGILHPRAIRELLVFARESWQPPAPRFVLLVGDASWDTKNVTVDDANYANWSNRQLEAGDRFKRKSSEVYGLEPEVNRRQLIPTWNHATYQGHSASDNYFVSLDGDDHLPEMAIGRLPVVEPEEVAGIVDKTVRYAAAPEVGPWRRNALLITNESRGFQRQSDGLARRLAASGLASSKVYPASTEVSNEHHTRELIETLNQGQLLVHFLGHGGRYIWRTGPPDLKKNHDLFTLDHLEQLSPTGRLPVVLSLTCFSAPFDHPNADSIGEKLLRIGERGAVAVLAASWRNSPTAQWGIVLTEELTAPGATVGEAVMRAKHRIRNRMFVETYNLLGDPAVPVALPAAGIELRAGDEAAADGRWSVRGVVGVDGFAGRVVVDLVDAAGEALHSAELASAAPEFAVELAVTAEELAAARGVRAYAWNVERGVDAVGALALPATLPPLPGGVRGGVGNPVPPQERRQTLARPPTHNGPPPSPGGV